MKEELFNKDRCLQRNRVAALRYGVDTAHVNFLKGAEDGAPVEYRNYGGRMPDSDEDALAMINAMLPEGADPLSLSDVYIHYVEAANNNFIADRYAFISRNTLRNIAKDAAAGAAFMNSHRTGGLSTDGEFPFGKTFAGQYQEGRDAEGRAVQRTLLGFYMLRGLRPNGDAGPSTDDLDRKIRGGTLFDVSVGLYGGSRVCDVCGGDVTDYDSCPHVPGTHYAMDDDDIAAQKERGVPDGKATYSIEGASLGEVSGVFDGAVRGAGFRKAVKLKSKLAGADLQLAREVYGGLMAKEEGEAPVEDGVLERVAEFLTRRFPKVFGTREPNTAGAPDPIVEPPAPDRQEEAAMADQKNDDEVEKLRRDSEELAALKKRQREAAAKQFAADAVSKYKNLLPFGAEGLAGFYSRLADDDAERPLASGSRVEQLQSLFKALPAHNLTSEVAASELPPGAVALDNDADPDKALVKQGVESAKSYADKANAAGQPRK